MKMLTKLARVTELLNSRATIHILTGEPKGYYSMLLYIVYNELGSRELDSLNFLEL